MKLCGAICLEAHASCVEWELVEEAGTKCASTVRAEASKNVEYDYDMALPFGECPTKGKAGREQ